MKSFALRDYRAPAGGAGQLGWVLVTACLAIVLVSTRASGASVLPRDSHAVSGTARPPVRPSARPPVRPLVRLSGQDQDQDQDTPTAAEAWSYVVTRWWTFSAIVMLLGAVCFGSVVAPAVGREAPPALSSELDRRTRLVGLVAAVAVVVGVVVRVMAQRAMLREALGTESPITLADVLSGMFGVGVAMQLIGGLAGLLAFAPRLGRRTSQTLAWGAVACVVAPALSGHAAGEDSFVLPVFADTVHMLAAGAWVGTLLLLAVVGIPAVLRHAENEPQAPMLAMLRVFSPVALGSATLLAATGLYASWVHVASFDALWTTRYGNALLIKLALVAAMIVAGAINWRRMGPSAGTADGARRLSRSAWLELAIAALILLVTAVLVARPTPADMMP